jgi:tRNA (cmo5U34)-methyltransferase
MDKAVREIGEDEFFYVTQDNYDEHIELAIPFYQLMHKELIRYIPDTGRTVRALDLGCGTGKTSAMLLMNFPKLTVCAIDLFDEMLKHAKARLAKYDGRVNYVRGDFRTVPLGTDYDVCTAALAIHHSTKSEKQELFSRICEALVPRGRFIMIDWTKFLSPFVQNVSAAVAEGNVKESGVGENIISEWCSHWREKNIPETVQDLQEWLLRAGFSSAECVIRYYGMAMICAEK